MKRHIGVSIVNKMTDAKIVELLVCLIVVQIGCISHFSVWAAFFLGVKKNLIRRTTITAPFGRII